MKNNIEDFQVTNKSLDAVYSEINVIYRQTESTELCSSSDKFKAYVKQGLTLSRYLWVAVDSISLYSNNENIEDVTTKSLKFMTVPAMIGYFCQLQTNPNEKLNLLKEAKKYYNIFIELMRDYKFKGVNEDFGLVVETREDKINRFKEEKSCKERFIQLEKYIYQDNVDDEKKREFYINSIKQWIYKIKADLKFLNDEIYFLENAETIKEEMLKPQAPKTEFKPYVITSDMVKKSVFGVGYKSLPTYSLEEYYIKQVEMGHLPDPNVDVLPKGDGSTVRRIVPDVASEEEKLAERNDNLEDSDDIEDRLKKIRMDEYKDENRRGCGSTLNRG